MLIKGITMRKIFIILLLFSTLIYSAPLTFESAVNIALENNLSVKMAENRLKMMENQVNPGVLLPTMSLTGNSQYTNTETAAGRETETHLNSGSISTSYTLFSGFYVLNSYKKLKMQYDQSELETRYQVESIIYGIAQAYYALANADEQYRLSKESLKISRSRLRRIEEKEKIGQASRVEFLSAKVDYNRDSVTVEETKLNYQNSRRALNKLLNRDIDYETEISKDIRLINLPIRNELEQLALKKNAEYRAAILGIDLSKMDIKLARSAYMPRLNISGSYGLSKTHSAFDPSLDDPDNSYSVGLSLNFSIFDGFKRSIQTQNAKIGLKNQQLAVEEAKLVLKENLANSYEAYNQSRIMLSIEKENLAAAKANFARTKQLFELGQVTSVQFREAQLNLMNARRNISAGQFTVKLRELKLLQLAGMLLD